MMTASPAPHPPAYISVKSLARELDCSESTVHEMVRRGVIPPGQKLSSGCTRWRWADIDAVLRRYYEGTSGTAQDDPYSQGARNAAQAPKGSRNAP